jgi:hypothetical protein
MLRDLLTLGMALTAGAVALWALYVSRENRLLRMSLSAVLEAAVIPLLGVAEGWPDQPDEPVTTTTSEAVH